MRCIRPTELIPPLPGMVDERKIAFDPAYEPSLLKRDEQQKYGQETTVYSVGQYEEKPESHGSVRPAEHLLLCPYRASK